MKRKLFGKRLKIQLGAGIVILIVLMAIFAPLLAPYDPYAQNLMVRLVPVLRILPVKLFTLPLRTQALAARLMQTLNSLTIRLHTMVRYK